MANPVDVAVVGAGMFGSATAKYLQRAGADVLVVGPAEPRTHGEVDQYSFGAHFDEARITRRLGWDEVWGALDSVSLDRFRDIEADSGVDFFHECGSLVIMARSIAHRSDAILRNCADTGVAVDRLSAEALRCRFPDLGLPPMAGGVEGLFEPEHAGYLNPRRLVQAQLVLTRAAGGRLVRGAVTAVTKDRVSRLWRLGLRTPDGGDEVLAERVVVAAGAFTNVNNVLPGGQRLAMHAFGEPNLLYEISADQLDRFAELPSVVTVDPADNGDANTSLYLLPPVRYGDGNWYLRIGPGMQPIVTELRGAAEMTAWCADQRLTPRQDLCLGSMTRMLVPELKPASVRPACCIVEKTPSRYPYLGPLDDDDTFTVAVGGNGHGARGSDEIGRLAASVALGQPWQCPIPPEVFAPITGAVGAYATESRPDFLKPPFGLC
jgi:sarcosine oxidase